ncbi:MAG: 3-deoxy-manno-octulosonate cytidylyltransferase [Puniceicoccales bacterium]|jgi:3-deoxy-manno-octulosonate cytidylyltransferase (CMP-KDO synthetase)|nr:3-deoxy-manno-octulosonate cytidylyltransferase [Puniceicoccales bacterium]
MTFSIAIPARLQSTRLPGKVLADLGGKPVLKHVWETANRIKDVREVIVLTESAEVLDAVMDWGGICYLTPESCNSGTERIASALDYFSGDFIFNVQSDEPFLKDKLLESMIARTLTNGALDVLTPVYPLTDVGDILNPNVVKVVIAHGGEALYFSRSPIPHVRGAGSDKWLSMTQFFGHMGVYLYAREILERVPFLPRSSLATAESLEQLQLLQAGYHIQVIPADGPSIAIDTAEDLARAREIIRENHVDAN